MLKKVYRLIWVDKEEKPEKTPQQKEVIMKRPSKKKRYPIVLLCLQTCIK